MPKRLEWDKTGERFYEAGVSHGVLYPQDSAGKYPQGVVWNGLTAVNDQPDGAEPNDLYADNIKYGSLRSKETYKATIEAYMYPPEFAECDGSAKVAPGIYIGQQSRKPFGFSYQTLLGNDTASDEDDGYKLHIVYNATASPSEKNYETLNDSPDAITFSWEIETTPVVAPGYQPSSTITISSLETDKAVMSAIEDMLYGTAEKEAYLPLPEEIFDLLKTVTPTTPEVTE